MDIRNIFNREKNKNKRLIQRLKDNAVNANDQLKKLEKILIVT